YNGMPNGCDDDLLPWARSASNKLDTKYLYGNFIFNAILFENEQRQIGCEIIYFVFFIFVGIKDVIYMSDKYHDTPEMAASRRLFDLAGIEYKQFAPKCRKIVIDFDSINHSGMNQETK
uniref:dCMP deaminase n=1 Tax=Erpetoichthys calabaricus TaxID=27687 RepID=A0A8C4RMX7_ERPCA